MLASAVQPSGVGTVGLPSASPTTNGRMSRREILDAHILSAKAHRAPYELDYEEIARLSMTSRLQYLGAGGARSNTRRANTTLQDTAGLISGRIVTNGMSNGLSSNARPWFKLAPPDPDMLEYQPVKEWLAQVEAAIYRHFAKTNYYDCCKVQYGELSHMGIGASISVEHAEYGMVYHPLQIGEYWITQDDGLRVDSLSRSYNATVKQVVDATRDWSRISATVKGLYDRGAYSTLVPCMHTIEKNTGRDPEKLDVGNKPWSSFKWEVGNGDKSVMLSESGYDSKPFTAPRWETTGGFYCDSAPGFNALADLREIQLIARRLARATDNLVKPALGAPAGLAQTGLSLDPGTVNYMDSQSLGQTGPLVQPIYQAIPALEARQEWHTRRVNELFYADLFTAISDMEGVQPRNEQELLYRNEEKLTQLGPVVDRVNIEKLEVDIDRAYSYLDRTGQLPPPPPEMQGQALTVEFVSMLAQAQKASANSQIERAARFVGFLAGIFPEAVIKYDAQEAIDQFAQNTGTSPKIIRSDEIVAKMQAQMQQQQEAQQNAQMAQPAKDAAQAAQLLSQTRVDPGGDSMLNRMVGAG